MCEPGVLSLHNGGRSEGRGAEDAEADGAQNAGFVAMRQRAGCGGWIRAR